MMNIQLLYYNLSVLGMLSDIEESQNDDLTTPLSTPAAGSVNKAFDFDEESEENTPEENKSEKIIEPEGIVKFIN